VQQLNQAVQALRAHPMIQSLRVSPYYQSAPMGPKDQPDYVNAVVECVTDLSPLELLDLCQSIEQAQLRVRARHWGERTLDVDILSIGDLVMQSERLTLPHPGIIDRDFVVLPWRDLAPDYPIPTLCLVSQLTCTREFNAQPMTPS
jgi:2-amino-4-hydroxy-6-hydroxymethyldihydropteridine diphosphokinase